MKASLLISVVILLGFALFQNCSPVSHSGDAPPFDPTTKAGGGNGDVYGGKAYLNLNPLGKCTDGSYVRSSIVGASDTGYYLVRDNCLPVIPGRLLNSGEVTERDADHLVYQGLLYTLEGADSKSLAYGELSKPGVVEDAVTTFSTDRPGILTASVSLTFSSSAATGLRMILSGDNGFIGCGNGASFPPYPSGPATINTSCVQAIPAGTYTLRTVIQGPVTTVHQHDVRFVVVPR